jgi:hypothetical protein
MLASPPRALPGSSPRHLGTDCARPLPGLINKVFSPRPRGNLPGSSPVLLSPGLENDSDDLVQMASSVRLQIPSVAESVLLEEMGTRASTSQEDYPKKWLGAPAEEG